MDCEEQKQYIEQILTMPTLSKKNKIIIFLDIF